MGGLVEPAAPASARVLVVDDDAMVREVLAGEMMDRGYRVAQADQGLEALAYHNRRAAVNLLISDFAMPGVKGLTLIQWDSADCFDPDAGEPLG